MNSEYIAHLAKMCTTELENWFDWNVQEQNVQWSLQKNFLAFDVLTNNHQDYRGEAGAILYDVFCAVFGTSLGMSLIDSEAYPNDVTDEGQTIIARYLRHIAKKSK